MPRGFPPPAALVPQASGAMMWPRQSVNSKMRSSLAGVLLVEAAAGCAVAAERRSRRAHRHRALDAHNDRGSACNDR